MMMNPLRKPLLAVLAAFLVLGGWLLNAGPLTPVQAEDPEPTPEVQVRKARIAIEFIRTDWWLVEWTDNEIWCRLSVEHEGIPTYNEIEGLCGKRTANYWLSSVPCNLAEKTAAQCPGLYFIQMGAQPGRREIEVELPLPEVFVSVDGCNPLEGERRCTTLPNLVFNGVEPLPNETIVAIQGTINGQPFTCADGACRLPLQPTGLEGVTVEFWADSSFGDSSPHYEAKVRLVPWGDFMNPEGDGQDPSAWYVDVLSSQWTGGDVASCSYTWQAFPDLNGPPEWLLSPTEAADLVTQSGYYYLAGALITNGVADASTCLDGGLQALNLASACGVEAARPYLEQWQNRFDGEILQASQDTGIPARLLKNVFARESQIWPGFFTSINEAGLGQLTEQGADTVLLWNPDFFQQFCPLVLHQSYCDLGWGNLKRPEQAMLRGALLRKVNAACPDCPTGIDISDASTSVNVFAEGMLANCEQTGQILRNLTGQDPGRVSSYEDLWRFTLVNYNAGPGCLSNAIRLAQANGRPLDWASVTTYLEPGCQAAIGYVEDISRVLKATPTP
ncbi:MAG: hypothetical protein HY835_01430, partial [Anaerolineae bacterium]|nr:hypothetical protein [Anaerolineae bacterium]